MRTAIFILLILLMCAPAVTAADCPPYPGDGGRPYDPGPGESFHQIMRSGHFLQNAYFLQRGCLIQAVVVLHDRDVNDRAVYLAKLSAEFLAGRLQVDAPTGIYQWRAYVVAVPSKRTVAERPVPESDRGWINK